MKYWPIILTVLLICWTLIVSPFTSYGDRWALIPVLVVFASVVAIHLRRLFKEGWTSGEVIYGILSVGILFLVSIWSLTLISKDSL
jgi:hypothetical protein